MYCWHGNCRFPSHLSDSVELARFATFAYCGMLLLNIGFIYSQPHSPVSASFPGSSQSQPHSQAHPSLSLIPRLIPVSASFPGSFPGLIPKLVPQSQPHSQARSPVSSPRLWSLPSFAISKELGRGGGWDVVKWALTRENMTHLFELRPHVR